MSKNAVYRQAKQEKKVDKGYVKVSVEWLQSLLKCVKEAETEYNRSLTGESLKYVIAVNTLIGFASSAESILKYGEKTR
jgi:hypothetical protein